MESSCVSRRWRPAACYCCLKPVVVSSGCLNRRFTRLWSSSRLWFTQSVKLETYKSWHGAGIYALDTILILTCETFFDIARKIWHNCDDTSSVSSCPVAENSRQTVGNIKGAIRRNSSDKSRHGLNSSLESLWAEPLSHFKIQAVTSWFNLYIMCLLFHLSYIFTVRQQLVSLQSPHAW